MDFKEKVEEKRKELVDTLLKYIETNPERWERGWCSVSNEPAFNPISQKRYKGLNAFYLYALGEMHGYKDPRWLTFKQAKDLGANVKQGEHSANIFYWNLYDKSTKQSFSEETVKDLNEEERNKYFEDNVRPVLKYYQVFNAEQCDNMPEYNRTAEQQSMAEEERAQQNALIERVISNSSAPISYGGNQAYYNPSTDSIRLPEIESFKSMQDYYATALHEIAHSTGHESRLNRNIKNTFGTQKYAKEELRAELASVFMQLDMGLRIEGKHFENHGAYLASWLKAVKQDVKEFYSASADAEKISEYVAKNYAQEKVIAQEIQKEEHKEKIDNKDVERQPSDNKSEQVHQRPLIINFYSGPGAGKTTVALELTAELKKAGFNVEYVPEYAKELVLENKTELLKDQQHVIDEQYRRLDRFRDSVDVIVTDSPLLLGQVYGEGRISAEYHNQIRSYYDSFDNFNLWVTRGNEAYQQAGRVESAEQAKELDGRIMSMIKANKIYYGNYNRGEIAKTVNRIKQTYNRLYGEQKNENTKENEIKQVEQAEQVQQSTQREREEQILREDFPRDFEDAFTKAVLDEIEEEQAKQTEQSYTIKSQVKGWSDWSTAEIKDKRARESAEWLIKNGLESEKDVKSAFRDYQTHDMADYIEDARKSAEKAIIRVAGEYMQKFEGQEKENTKENQVKKVQQVKQVQQAEQVQQVKQVEQVQQATAWREIDLKKENIVKEYGQSTMIRVPDGEYSSFVFSAPKKLVKTNEKKGLIKLSVKEDWQYELKNNGLLVELNGSELCDVFAGKVVGKQANRVAPTYQNSRRLENIKENVPEEMKSMPNWCAYKTRWNEAKGKKDKSIFSPALGLNKDGKMQWASIDKPETWATFDKAMEFAIKNNCDGLSFAMDGSGISCIDLDKCIVLNGKLNGKDTTLEEGAMNETAQKLISELTGYCETSVSGNGLHFFLKDDILNNGKYKNRVELPSGDEIEVYDDKRFMSITGNIRSNTNELNRCPSSTATWLREQLGARVTEQAKPKPSNTNRNQNIDMSDSAVIERIRRSKKGQEFDELFRSGSYSGDHSRDDLRMLNILAFFTQANESQMARIFRDSALYRPEKEKYLARSIRTACSSVYGEYSGSGNSQNRQRVNQQNNGRR